MTSMPVARLSPQAVRTDAQERFATSASVDSKQMTSQFLKTVRAHIQKIAGSRASAGFSAVIWWEAWHFADKLCLPQPPLWRIRPRQVDHPLQARLRGSSDLSVFEQIFIDQEYFCLRDLDEPFLVLDLGANVGYSSAYFLNVYPKARIVAVEPDEWNLAICKANLLPYGDRVLLLHGAAWSRPTTLRLLRGTFADGREWTTQVEEFTEEGTSASVQAWDVGTLIDMCGGSMVDLLKVDIERAELSVFGEGASCWLERIRNICIELHGRESEEVFFAALEGLRL